MPVKKACDEIVPIFFVEGFSYPTFERTIIVDSYFRDINKKEAEILNNVVFVVEKRTSNTPNIVTAHSHHLLGRAVVWSPHCLSKKIKLAGGNHVAGSRDIVKHPLHMLIVEAFVLHSKHGNVMNPLDVSME